MTTFLDTLEASAKAATKGPWLTMFCDEGCAEAQILAPDREPICDLHVRSDEPQPARNPQLDADAAYIALANPNNILALVRVARAVERHHWLQKQPGLSEEHQHDIADAEREVVAALAALDALPK